MESDFPFSPKALRNTGRVSLLLALAQSICTAVLTVSSIRVIIGLSALAEAAGVYEPATGFHQDWIRIPMLILATVGSLINLAVIAWIRYLRNRPSAQWRRRELTAKEKRSERLQIALALITLILVALETWTHTIVFRHGLPPAAQSSATAPPTGQPGV
jgi:heme/copper-type cytochrome/quinol oxidase subunit 2